MSRWPGEETFQHSSYRPSNGHIKQTLQSVEELARLNRLGSQYVGDAFDCEEPIRDEPPCVPTSLKGPDTDEAEKMQVSPILQSQLHLEPIERISGISQHRCWIQIVKEVQDLLDIIEQDIRFMAEDPQEATMHLDRSTALVHGDLPLTAEQEQEQGGKGCFGDQSVWS